MGNLSITIDSYNKNADWHSAKFDNYNWREYSKKFVKLLKGTRVLDFGCGNGRDLGFLSKFKLNLVGIDYSQRMVEIARSRVKNIRIVQMNFLKKIKFYDNEFDGVWACAAILHIPKKSLKKVLLEIKRVLKNGGVLFISVKEGIGERLIKDDGGKRFFSFYSKNELVNLLKNIGFKLLKSFKVPDNELRAETGKRAKNKIRQNWIVLYLENLK